MLSQIISQTEKASLHPFSVP